MKCPICQNHELVAQSLEDIYGGQPDIFCPAIVKLPDGKVLNHYRENPYYHKVRMIAMPYRVMTHMGKSKVSVLSQYKSGKYYFKTILNIPELHSDTEDKLRDRIKLLVLLS